MTWCLAESAPKTGEHILVSNHGRGDFGVCGGKTQDFCAVVHYWEVPGEEGFYLSNGYPHSEDVETPIRFTHWLPLDVLGVPSRAALPPHAPASPAETYERLSGAETQSTAHPTDAASPARHQRVAELREIVRVGVASWSTVEQTDAATAAMNELCALASGERGTTEEQPAPTPETPA